LDHKKENKVDIKYYTYKIFDHAIIKHGTIFVDDNKYALNVHSVVETMKKKNQYYYYIVHEANLRNLAEKKSK